MHSLRAAFATRLAEANVDPYVIMELMGHTSIATTMHYVKVRSGRTREAIEAAAELIA